MRRESRLRCLRIKKKRFESIINFNGIYTSHVRQFQIDFNTSKGCLCIACIKNGIHSTDMHLSHRG